MREPEARAHLVKDSLQSFLCEGGALEVLDSPHLPPQPRPLTARHGLLLAGRQRLHHLHVVPEVGLGAHQDEGSLGAEVLDLRHPGLLHILESGGGDHAEADDEDVRLGVGERPQLVEVRLAGCVEEVESVGLLADHHCGRVVLKYLRHRAS